MDDKIRSAFDAVRADDALKDRTADFLAARVYAKRRRVSLRRAIPALCCLLLVLLSVLGSNIYAMPVAAISVDDVELEVNAFDRVVGVSCYDGETQCKVENLGLMHKSYSAAVDELLALGGGEVSVSSENASRQDSMRESIESHHGAVHCHSESDAEAAHESGMSVGKYRVFLELQALDPSITAYDVRDFSMHDLRARLAELSETESKPETAVSADAAPDDHAGNGSQHRHGKNHE